MLYLSASRDCSEDSDAPAPTTPSVLPYSTGSAEASSPLEVLMELFALSIPEAAFLYIGIAIQSILRPTLAVLAFPIIFINTLRLLPRTLDGNGPWALFQPISYVVTSLAIAGMFLPSTFRLGSTVETVSPAAVRSFAAVSDGAPIQTATDSGMVPSGILSGASLPVPAAMMLRAGMDTTLALAQVVSDNPDRPFSAIQPMEWFLTQRLSGEMIAAIRDFTAGCYLLAQAAYYNAGAGGGAALGYQDLLPWDGVLGAELTRLKVVVGASNGQWALVRKVFSVASEKVTCAQYASMISLKTLAEVNALKTASGSSMAAIWEAELGIEPLDAARILAFREIARAAGPAIPTPSLTGSYVALRTTALIANITGRVFSGKGTALVQQGLASELEALMNGASAALKPALFIIWWAPYLLGFFNMVILALFPVVVHLSLVPGQQFRYLIGYFVLLTVTTATPLWWGLVDLGARSAAGFGSFNVLTDTPRYLGNVVTHVAITAFGVVAVFIAFLTVLGWVGLRVRGRIVN